MTLQQIDGLYRQSEGLSSSNLKELLTSPALYYAKFVARTMPLKETYAMDFGTKVHAALLEPELFAKSFKAFPSYLALPAKDFASVKGRCQWEPVDSSLVPDDGHTYFKEAKSDDALKTQIDRLSEYYGMEIITPNEQKVIANLLQELKLNPQVDNLLQQKKSTEVVLRGNFDEIQLKGKLDAIIGDQVFDYKTCEHAINDELILWTIKKYSYDLQAYFYLHLAKQNNLNVNGFTWVFQNKTTGQCAVVPCPEAILASGAKKFKLGLSIFDRCTATGIFADFVDEHGNTNYDAPMDLTRKLDKVFGGINND